MKINGTTLVALAVIAGLLVALILPKTLRRFSVEYETTDPSSGYRLEAFVQSCEGIPFIGAQDLLVRVLQNGHEVCRVRVLKSMDSWKDRNLPENHITGLSLAGDKRLTVTYENGKQSNICLGLGAFESER